jgi:hypothetical protein
MITKLKIQVEEENIIKEALKEQLEERNRIIGSRDSQIEKTSSEEKHAKHI